MPKVTPGQQEHAINAVEWGIANINADDVWSQYGDKGEGIVIANIDTGVQYDHPALVNQYRGNNGDGTFNHNYNWFDAAGTSPNAPCRRQRPRHPHDGHHGRRRRRGQPDRRRARASSGSPRTAAARATPR